MEAWVPLLTAFSLSTETMSVEKSLIKLHFKEHSYPKKKAAQIDQRLTWDKGKGTCLAPWEYFCLLCFACILEKTPSKVKYTFNITYERHSRKCVLPKPRMLAQHQPLFKGCSHAVVFIRYSLSPTEGQGLNWTQLKGTFTSRRQRPWFFLTLQIKHYISKILKWTWWFNHWCNFTQQQRSKLLLGSHGSSGEENLMLSITSDLSFYPASCSQVDAVHQGCKPGVPQ